jgi:hypothetical protein
MMGDARIRAVERLQRAAARFKPHFNRQASQEALFREYLRLMALWAQGLQCQVKWPFFNVAALLFPERFTTDVQSDLQFPPLPQLGGAFRMALTASVDFAEVADTAEVRARGLPDPYEPLVRLFERGGTVTTEHGMIYVGLVGFPRKPFHPPVIGVPLALDEAALDALDGM